MKKGKKLFGVFFGLVAAFMALHIMAMNQEDVFAKASNDLSTDGSITFSQEKYIFKGKAVKPKVAVYSDGKKLKKNKEYMLSLEDNNAIGKGKATASGIGDYTGQITAEFSIIPSPVKIKKIVDFKSGFEVLWKASKYIDGYEIESSTDSSFKTVKKTKISDGDATSAKIKNLEPNNTYFIRLRSYKVVNEKFFYSNWSKTKKFLVAPYDKDDDGGDEGGGGDDGGDDGEDLEEYNYLIIDLETNEISYLDEVPEGGWTDEYKTTKMVFRLIKPGTFIMGSPKDEIGRDDDEVYHEVKLTKPYYLGVFEVTQKQYQLIAGTVPAKYEGAARPVESVSYEEIRGENFGYEWPYHSEVDEYSFMGILRSKVNLNFDLPTEAQWEYACRAGTITPLNDGNYLTNKYEDGNLNKLGRYSEDRFDYSTHAIVGSYLPNAWGLYDMHGNVQEWCLDLYNEDFESEQSIDPPGPYDGYGRVTRGGSWDFNAYGCRSANRNNIDSDDCYSDLGFRVAISDYIFNSSYPKRYSLYIESDTENPLPIFETKIYVVFDDGSERLLEDIGTYDEGSDGTVIGTGFHNIVWRLKERAYLRQCENLNYRVEYVDVTDQAKYLVFDLLTNHMRFSKTGPNINNDKCRTDELWLRRIEAGSYSMGSPETELGRHDGETKHKVTLTRPYYIGVFEITQKQYETIKGNNPSRYYGDMRPVEGVSYNMIRGSYYGKEWPDSTYVDDYSFLGILWSKFRVDFDLPTEAQWEFACRAGTTTALNSGKDLSNSEEAPEMNEVGRYNFNIGDGKGGYGQHTTVGSYLPNSKGLYDMHGNVAEWCLDWYKSINCDAPVTDPVGSTTVGRLRCIRGGGWGSDAKGCRSAERDSLEPSLYNGNVGFRVVLDKKSYPHYDKVKLYPRTFEYEISHETQNTFPVLKPILYAKFKDGKTCVLEDMGRLEGDGACGIVVGGGKYKVTWYPDDIYDDFEFKVKFEDHSAKAKYLVLDLQTGKIRASEAGPDLNYNTCRTTELWLRRIEPGSFVMGSPSGEIGRADDEGKHKVTLTKAFYIGVFETTQKQYELLYGNNPSSYKGDSRPVDYVSYNALRGSYNGSHWPADDEVDSNSFFGKLRTKTNLIFDLPTEAQWECACRAGTTTSLNNGKDLSNSEEDPEMNAVGRYNFNKDDGKGGYSQHTTVGSYLPNSRGLYDMHGNVSEWCLDWYASYDGTAVDPEGTKSGKYRVLRGGNWSSSAKDCRSAKRLSNNSSSSYASYGFRVVLNKMRIKPKTFEYEISHETQNTFPVLKPILYAKFKDGTTRLLEDMGRLEGDGACGIVVGGGKYTVTWYPDNFYDDFEFKAKFEDYSAKAKYLVLDLQTSKIRASKIGPDLSDDTCRTSELWLRRIEPGIFSMGSPESEVGRARIEEKHQVTLTKAFYIGVFETTQKQYENLTSTNPSQYTGATRPVENVSYKMLRGNSQGTYWPANNEVDETSFFGRLRSKTRLTFDLPTEAQWEYACRAGTTTALNNGKNLSNSEEDSKMNEVGRYNYNRDDGKGGHSQHAIVGSYLPNSKGLYDMHGNVCEWCLDWKSSNIDSDPVTDPKGAKSGYYRVFRGGNWQSTAANCRSAAHNFSAPGDVYNTFGFRIILSPEK